MKQENEFYIATAPGCPEGSKYISIDAVVNLNFGIGPLTTLARLGEECRKYQRQIFFVRKDRPDIRADGKDITALLLLEAVKGTELQILVEGDDEEAKTFASRLYSAVTSENSYDMDFKGHEEEVK